MRLRKNLMALKQLIYNNASIKEILILLFDKNGVF